MEGDYHKWKRLNTLKQNIRTLDRTVEKDILDGNLNAVAVSVMRQTGMRVGGDESIRGRLVKDCTFGVTTLRAKHAKITPQGTLILNFIGKKGVRHRHVINDKLLVESFGGLLREIRGNDPIFPYHVNNKSTMEYIRHTIGIPDIKNHDLRTYVANEIAVSEISSLPEPTSEKEYRKLRNSVGDVVADKLGNGRYHALNSYIDPALFDVWRKSGWTP